VFTQMILDLCDSSWYFGGHI